ncbi:MAG TPA: hypothetical protein VJG90_02485 [Candidatus Nanoarchaeia archaeon]|nr:hypothetical protein [Candidatus Nanoarchaeia archaeon]
MHQTFFAFFLILLLPFSIALTLKDYYSNPQKQMISERYVLSSTYERSAQFRPSPIIYRTTTEIQNDVHRLVLQHLKYPIDKIPAHEIEWVRQHRETLYHPLQKRTVWTITLTDEELKKLLTRPDVRNTLGFTPLSFKPTI